MAIYCMQCGKELPDDANFCLKCGKPLREVKVVSQTPLSLGEIEFYHTTLLDGRTLIVTNQRIIILGKHLVRLFLREIESVHATPSWGFFGTPEVNVRVKPTSGGISDDEIKCHSMDQAREIAEQIQRAMVAGGN